MNTPFPTLIQSTCSLVMLTLAFYAATSAAATTAYMSSTEQLDLRQVQLVVVAPDQLRESLRKRALARFTEAGLSPPNAHSSPTSPPTDLTLTLDPRPIGDLCPGKVLYAPSLTLTETVTITRTGSVIQDTTWLFETGTEIRGPVDHDRITSDVDLLIHQFITDYKTANHQLREGHTPPNNESEPQFAMAPDMPDRHTALELQKIRMFSLSVLAQQGSSTLKANAVRDLTEAGLRSIDDVAGTGAVSLSLELIQRSIDEHCRGKIIYERGFYLVEQVRITRRPLVMLWSDTWFEESVLVVPLLSRKELEADQHMLIQKFLHSRETE
ncbi:MAG: hypothetical protein AB7L09_22870 [Nitrospira sp.]